MEDAKYKFISVTVQGTLQEIYVNKDRKESRKLDKFFAAKDQMVKTLELLKERENGCLEAFIKMIEEKYADALTFFEKLSESKQEKNAMIEKLTDEVRTVKSELEKVEELLNECKGHRNVLLKVMLTERQEAQEAETLKDAQNEQSFEVHNTTNGLETSPSSTKEPTLSSAPSVIDSNLDNDSRACEEKLQLYFSEPQQLMVLLSKLTDQNLSLIQNSTGMDNMMEQTIEITIKTMKEDEKKLTLQTNDMKDRLDAETERCVILKKKVQLYDSLKTQDQDIMLHTLAQKVSKVYAGNVDKRLTILSTLEKLSSIEYRSSLLLQQIESIPEETLKTLRRIKDMERRSRLREEELRLEMEKQAERRKKCIRRSHEHTKKTHGRKLMPRCIPVIQKIQASEEATVEDKEEDLHDYLFKDGAD